MPVGDYIEGSLVFGALLGATAGGAWMIVAGRLAGLSGAPRLLAWALITTLGLLAVHLLPAALGVLSRGTVLLACVLWLGLGFALRRRGGGERGAPVAAAGHSPAGGVPVWAIAIPLGIVVALLLAVMREHLASPSGAIDVLNFHIPNVARWIQTGSIWQIDVFLPNVAPGHYPNNGDVILLAAILPWHNDFLAHLAMYPYWALTGLAVYALARELEAGRTASILASCLVVVIPAVAVPALIAGLVDALMLFAFATGLLFLVRYWRGHSAADLVLAGLALGVAFGTKWYGVSSVVLVVGIWTLGSLLIGRGFRRTARETLVLAGLIAVAGGIWMLRNLIESGNPVFPVRVAPAGLTIFDAPPDIVRETAGFTLLDYAGDPGVWDEFILPQLRRTLAAPAMLIALALALGVVALARRRPSAAATRPLIAGALTAVGLAAVYAVTPYSAGGPEGEPVLVAADARYAVPALVLAAAVAAASLQFGRAGGVVAWVLVLIAIIDGARWSAGATNEAAGLNPLTWGMAVLVTVAVALVWDRRRPIRPPGRGALVGAIAILAIAAGAAGYLVERRFNDDRYLGSDQAIDRLLAEEPAGGRVGIAGIWGDQGISPVLPAFGSRLENEVVYVAENVDDMLRRYGDQGGFAAALERGDFDLLVVGLGRPEAPGAPELRWAIRSGYRPLARSERFVLLQRSAPVPSM